MVCLGTIAGGLFVLAATAVVAGARAATEEPLARELQAVGRVAVFFGHQSVGGDVLDGVAELSRRVAVPLRLVEAPDGLREGPALAHARIGVNGDPASKLDAFERSFPAPDPDVALMKLCYVDFDSRTDAAALFDLYRTRIRALQRRHPRTIFVHVTAPLESLRRGAKAAVKRLLGRDDPAVVANARREQFNELLRREFAGREPVFDLARVEATQPDGSLLTAELGGRAIPLLVPAYTTDGGHLNPEGKERAARALVSVLAAAAEGRAADAR